MAMNILERQDVFREDKIYKLVAVERVGGSISLVSVLFIFLAYGLVPRVRNVQNNFIVFASISNIGASIASIIAYDGIEAGPNSALCQAQSFMFEMFMQSDPWWSLAMAINVFLVFYFHTSPDSFRKVWWIYCVICYGGPFAIALGLLLVRDDPRGPIYGTATIWCWVNDQWGFIRIYTYYMLIWICIIGSILCYFLVGWHVFRMRNRLRSFSTSRNRDQKDVEGKQNELQPEGIYGTVTTEVEVVHTAKLPEPKPTHVLRSVARASFNGSTSQVQESSENQYYSSVTTAPRSEPAVRPSFWRRVGTGIKVVSAKFHVSDPVKRAYLRTSFLFTMSVLCTWIPSSLNRIYGWVEGASPYQYQISSAAVLPLQGLWNALIFFITSWSGLSAWYRETIRGDVVAAERQKAGDGGMNERINAQPERFDNSLDSESATAGSEVELRRVSGVASKTSTSSL